MADGVASFDPLGPVFICYWTSDGADLASQLAWALRVTGVPVWHDRRDLLPGDIERRLGEALAADLSRFLQASRLLDLAGSSSAPCWPSRARSLPRTSPASDVFTTMLPTGCSGALSQADGSCVMTDSDVLGNARQSLVTSLMWARPVVVDEEVLEHGFKMAAAEDENVIEQLSARRPDPAPAKEFARGIR